MSQRWDQIKDLLNIQERMNRLFEDAMGPSPASDTEEQKTDGWVPMVDILETEQEFVIKLELTEISQQDIQISFENGKLTISGERKFPAGTRPEQYHCKERPCGTFERIFTLPQNIDDGKIAAEYSQGLLIVTVPKQGKGQARQINVKIG
jgi:HSP20 family protein